jgi:glycosyltransferase involved in cell wall biosynthesis
MLEFMSCSRPVILGVDGQARRILEEAACGLAIEPENPAALINAISHLAANRDQAGELGRNGREYVVRNLSRRRTAENYIRMLEELLKMPHPLDSQVAA